MYFWWFNNIDGIFYFLVLNIILVFELLEIIIWILVFNFWLFIVDVIVLKLFLFLEVRIFNLRGEYFGKVILGIVGEIR